MESVGYLSQEPGLACPVPRGSLLWPSSCCSWIQGLGTLGYLDTYVGYYFIFREKII